MRARSSPSGLLALAALIWALVVLLGQQAGAQTGPEAAQQHQRKLAILRTLSATGECMHGAVQAGLRYSADPAQLAGLAAGMCGGLLRAHLQADGGFTAAEIQSMVDTMARRETASSLSRIN